jgi:hypothetical protein
MTDVTARRLRLASSTIALIGGLVLALVVVDVPLARLAHQGLTPAAAHHRSGSRLP